MRKFFFSLLALLAITGAAIFYFTQDANRFKPELEALIAEQTGVPVKIEGDLGWRLFPPILLTAEKLSAEHEGRRWQLGRLALDIDVMTLIEDLDHWRIQALTIEDLTMEDGGDRLEVSHLKLEGFAFGEPALLATTLNYQPAGAPAIPLDLNGTLTYHPEPERYALSNVRFNTTDAEGICSLALQANTEPVTPAPQNADELIPVDTFREYAWQGTCTLDQLTYDDQTFTDVSIVLDNKNAVSSNDISIPVFFGGTAQVKVVIDAATTPVHWTIEPRLEKVNSQLLMEWLDQRLQWIASLAYGGTLSMTGNTEQELLASVSGETRFDGGQGQINIVKIKQQLLRIALLLNETDKVTALPDMWSYQRLVGNWRIDEQHHELDFALDNLTVLAEGDYNPETDKLDLLAELTFENNPDLPVFDINPMLMYLPIPVRCRGSIADPTCRIDDRAAQKIVASALASPDSPLHAKLEKKIEEKVPEEYQEAARAILDLLGGSREKRSREN
ncbi:MAG: AsmA family protein [Gammaproteobacteria bacterium]|nr:AsmA family protein [Gammaproteobacteria bacterium]